MSEYIAGSCNIGPSEINRRRQVALISLSAFCLLSIVMIGFVDSRALRLLVFLPAMGASVGYVQARRKFCLAYGFSGLFNFDRAGDVKKVVDAAALAEDRAYAKKVLITALVPALLMTALVVIA